MNRREALGRIALACAALAVPGWGNGTAQAAAGPEPTGVLAVCSVHTGERCRVRYRDGGGWIPEGLEELSRLFRCHYTGEVHPIAPELFDLLDRVQVALGRPGEPYELVSGYRSPRYNELLRRNGHGVARRSFHLRGMAADVRLPGVRLRDLRRAAQRLRVGGVGSYREFVHVDVGPVRYWKG
ncbi:YcbK family protein [Deferrisoma sp.]